MNFPAKIPVIGVGPDGLTGLTERSRDLLNHADIVFGSEAALRLLPELRAERVPIGTDLPAAVARLKSLVGQKRIAIAASGDPLFYGTARYFMERIGDETTFAIFGGIWNVNLETDPGDTAAPERFRDELTALFERFSDGGRRRLLLVGPVPEFSWNDPFRCIVLSRRVGLGVDRCGLPRSEVEARRRRTVAILREVVQNFPNARYVDPIDIFCDQRMCLPLKDDGVAYLDATHLNPYGAKLLFDRFEADFLWAFGR